MSLQVGDYVDFGAAGAYTDVYASAGFNGFAPPQVHCFGGRT
jgi:diaminopimelate decarboxylase